MQENPLRDSQYNKHSLCACSLSQIIYMKNVEEWERGSKIIIISNYSLERSAHIPIQWIEWNLFTQRTQ